MTRERAAAAAKVARTWDEGVCHYCAIPETQVDGDRIAWLGRRRTVCNRPGCVRKFRIDVDRALAAERRANRKRTPAEVHEQMMQEVRERRAASRARRKAKAA